MFKGFYTAASGMIAQQRRTEVITNNMANVNTAGFKQDGSTVRSFPEMLLSKYDQYTVPTQDPLKLVNGQKIGSISTGIYMQETVPLFTQGALKETGFTTDMALLDVNVGENGAFFFTVEGANGPLYTKNGNFTLDGAGYLTTASGMYVLDENDQRIQLSSDQFTVNSTGQISGANGELYQLGIGYASNTNDLIKQGDNLYYLENDQVADLAGLSFAVQQGYLEGSNVDMEGQMTELLTAYRAFEANQKVLQAYDKSMDKAANEIGRL